MTWTFLENEMESLALVIAAAVYITFVAIIQSKYLKQLNFINKKATQTKLNDVKTEISSLRKRTPLYLLIGLATHVLSIIILDFEAFRWGYLISILIIYLIFTVVIFTNFWLKGAGILKDIGDFNGLPG
ncbi:MAG: hypothetical protein BM555_03040 [Crocinitomix sp. MedPE-SWsnd]|nr:MAG: hypothetical protein BM555_03040 [Crocinitomix sp. MedPE-SWsnd]